MSDTIRTYADMPAGLLSYGMSLYCEIWDHHGNPAGAQWGKVTNVTAVGHGTTGHISGVPIYGTTGDHLKIEIDGGAIPSKTYAADKTVRITVDLTTVEELTDWDVIISADDEPTWPPFFVDGIRDGVENGCFVWGNDIAGAIMTMHATYGAKVYRAVIQA